MIDTVTTVLTIAAAIGGLLPAAISYMLRNKHEFYMKMRSEKVGYYRELLVAISYKARDRAPDTDYHELDVVCSKIPIAAPQVVIANLTEFINYADKQGWGVEVMDSQPYRRLMMSIRHDLSSIERDFTLSRDDRIDKLTLPVIRNCKTKSSN